MFEYVKRKRNEIKQDVLFNLHQLIYLIDAFSSEGTPESALVSQSWLVQNWLRSFTEQQGEITKSIYHSISIYQEKLELYSSLWN